jgi:hypothetical protein
MMDARLSGDSVSFQPAFLLGSPVSGFLPLRVF